MDYKGYIDSLVDRINRAIEDICRQYLTGPAKLRDAIQYGLSSGGKRIRPLLVLLSADACGGDTEEALIPAAALEAVHTFSLIHDDLPAMDDDDYRRGKPTLHKVFGEAIAILAGDGLFSFAFELISGFYKGSDSQKNRMIYELSIASGPCGMIGGQVLDIEFDPACICQPVELTGGDVHTGDIVDKIHKIHQMKTAALIRCACRLGAISADAPEERIAGLGDYGWYLGMAFQIVDDLLDITSSSNVVGKKVGKDKLKGRPNYAVYCKDGVDGARRKAFECINKAKDALVIIDEEKRGPFEYIADFVLERSC